MAFARVVEFSGVNRERIEGTRRQIEEGGRPDEIPATEIMLLWNEESETSLAILFFDNEEDYRKGDATLNAMPSGDTPGGRTSVTRYDVVVRMTG